MEKNTSELSTVVDSGEAPTVELGAGGSLACFHCGASTELRCSDCAIENELTHEGLPICTRKECRDKHDEWHTRPTPISALEDALNHGAEVTILPNGRVIAKANDSDEKPLTFRQDLGGEYASNQTYLEATEGECAECRKWLVWADNLTGNKHYLASKMRREIGVRLEPATQTAVPLNADPSDVIRYNALLAVLDRLKSKNRNPNRDWYLGWFAALDCLANDINARSNPTTQATVTPKADSSTTVPDESSVQHQSDSSESELSSTDSEVTIPPDDPIFNIGKEPVACYSDDSEVDICRWTINADPDCEVWETSCGNTFQFETDGPVENQFQFCCYCGKSLWSIVPREEGEE